MKDWRVTGVVPDSDEDEFDENEDAELDLDPAPTDVQEKVEEQQNAPAIPPKEDTPSSSAESDADGSKKVWSSQDRNGSASRSSPADLPPEKLQQLYQGLPEELSTDDSAIRPTDGNVAMEEEDEDDDMVELVVYPSRSGGPAAPSPTTPTLRLRKDSLEIPPSQDIQIPDIVDYDPSEMTPQKAVDTVDEGIATPKPAPVSAPPQSSPLSSPLSPALSLDGTPPPSMRPPPTFAVVLPMTPVRHQPSAPPTASSPPPSPPAQSQGTAPNEVTDTDAQSLQVAMDLANEDESFGIGARLRHRKPIQLNPYLIENERYRQSFKASGLKPVRIAEPTPTPNVTRQAAHDSQEEEWDASASTQVDGGEPPSSSAPAPEDEDDADQGMDNDLPSVHELLEQRTQRKNSDRRAFESGVKRRRLDVAGKPAATHLVIPKSVRNANALLNKTASVAEAIQRAERPVGTVPDPFAMPLSDDEDIPMNNFEVEQNNGGFESSSDSLPRSPEKRHPMSTPRASAISVLESSSDEAESDDSSQQRRIQAQEEREKTRYKKKLKGVLPASYLTINQKMTKNKNNEQQQHRHPAHSPERVVSRPGVARKVARGSRPLNTPDPIDSLLISDISSSDDEPPMSSRLPGSSRTASPPAGTDRSRPIFLGDSFEDNRIDTMVSRGPRTTYKKSQSNAPLRQSRIPFDANPKKRKSTDLSTGAKKKPKKTRHTPSRPRQRVSILDAPVQTSATRMKTPPFLGVAKRRARERKDKGRASPQGKFIQLDDDDEDSREVSQLLRNWREGTLPYGRMSTSSESTKKRHDQPRFSLEQHQGRKYQSRLDGMLVNSETSPAEKVTSSKSKSKPGQRTLAVVPRSSNAVFQRRVPQYMTMQLETVSSVRPWAAPTTYRRLDNVFDYLLQKSIPAPRHTTTHTAQKRSGAQASVYKPTNPAPLINNQSINDQPSLSELNRNVVHHPGRTRRKVTPTRNVAAVVEPKAYKVSDDISLVVESVPESSGQLLTGLASHGSLYSIDFGVLPFPEDVHFRADTFIGSGDLDQALKTPPARLAGETSGSSNGTFFGTMLRWEVFDEDLGAQFETIMRMIGDRLETQGDQYMDLTVSDFIEESLAFFRFVSHFMARTLSFSDLIDLIPFTRRVLPAIEELCLRINYTTTSSDRRRSEFALKTYLFSVLHIAQIQFLFGERRVPDEFPLQRMAAEMLHKLVLALLKSGLSQLRECYTAQRQSSQRREGIKSDNYIMEIWVTLRVLSANSELLRDKIWPAIDTAVGITDIGKAHDVPTFENRWNVLFTLLPTLQFNSNGKVTLPTNNSDDWKLVKALVSRVLAIYNSSTPLQRPKYNPYLRAIYGRCFELISRWGWTRPNDIIGVLYDFFARNKLNNLTKEEDRGSPHFLEELHKNPSLELEDRDLCFHIFLKIIVVGLKFLNRTAPPNAARNLVFRLVPNHGRMYPKEEELKREDLHALRNHHDLLTALYYAALPEHRFQLNILSDLVDPKKSHLAACRVALRTWSNIITFQLSNDCKISLLTPLMSWFSNIMEKTLQQHQQAQTQARAEYLALLNEGNYSVDEKQFDEVVRKNRRVFEDILFFGIGLLRHALKEMPKNVDAMVALMTKVATSSVFSLAFVLPDKLVMESLKVVQQFITLAQSFGVSSQQQSNEDSQNFDLSGFEDMVIESDMKKAAEFLLNEIHDPLHRLQSNCFGADSMPLEPILTSTLETWVSLVNFLVERGLKDWDECIGEYGKYSWFTLRKTEQRKKFTPKFLQQILGRSFPAYEGNKLSFISFWLATLVDRDAMLKFQHELTSTLFNSDPSNSLFQNPPFEGNRDGIYNIQSREFRERRLSLISTVLENIRISYDTTCTLSIAKAAEIKVEYSDMLKYFMSAMKDNYLELQDFQQGSSHKTSNNNHSSSYVTFVHQVIEYLQQFTADIVPIDRFFVDSAQFPLPGTDPTYVVGRLKNYGLKLDTSGTRKQLASFFHSMCERAAVDEQQGYLVSQLSTAFKPGASVEAMNVDKPSLRLFSALVLFPAYTRTSLVNLAGQVVGGPVINAAEKIISELICGVDSFNPSSVDAVLHMIVATWDSMRLAVEDWLKDRDLCVRAGQQETLAAYFRVLSSSLSVFEWLSESSTSAVMVEHAVECASYFVKLAGCLDNISGEVPPEFNPPVRSYIPPFQRERNDFHAELTNRLRRDFLLIGDELSAARGGSRRVVKYEKYKDLREQEAVRARLADGMQEYLKVAGRHPILKNIVKGGGKVERRRALRSVRISAVEGMYFCGVIPEGGGVDDHEDDGVFELED